MRLIVLGSGAGGGIPQWNANNPRSREAFANDPLTPRRTQASIAVSSDGDHWLLLNASPDLRQQIIATPALHPKGPALRHSPIAAVMLTGADVDQVAGLLTLRERQPFTLYASTRVQKALAANPIFNVLSPDKVQRKILPLGQEVQAIPGLKVWAFPAPGKVALYMEDETKAALGTEEGDTVATLIEDVITGRSVVFAPSCATVAEDILTLASSAHCLLFDGTFFTEEEMLATGEGTKTAARMGHVPMSGEKGSMNAFMNITDTRKLYIHINNTNPASRRGTPEELQIRRAGWELAEDGMEIVL
ncbi:MAG: pyrroloquinoline quinone biosynthesis protein PqqB [Alphaproteobacteria bacterium]|nr:pyrroloquinoline quinone biosynthesis protein PqqB [Alphaproteobacteria bacterium]